MTKFIWKPFLKYFLLNNLSLFALLEIRATVLHILILLSVFLNFLFWNFLSFGEEFWVTSSVMSSSSGFLYSDLHNKLWNASIKFLTLVIIFCFSKSMYSVQFSCSVMSDSLRPYGLSMPGLPVHHQLPELAQTHVHRVGGAIQPSHPLSSPSPPTFNLSQHQSVSQWVSSSHQVARVLEFQLQHQSFQWIFRTDFLWDGLVGSPCRPRDSQESSPTPQFKSISSSALSFLYIPTLTSVHDYWKNHSFD